MCRFTFPVAKLHWYC